MYSAAATSHHRSERVHTMTASSVKTSIADAGEALGSDIQHHIDSVFRRCVRGPHATCESRFVRLLTGEGHPFANFALVSDASDRDAMREAIEPLCASGQPSAVLMPEQPTPEMIEYLRTQAFESHEPMPAMAVNISEMVSPGWSSNCVLQSIAAGAQGDAWARAFAEGYELPLQCAAAFGPNATMPRSASDFPVEYFAIVRNGRQICTSLLALHDGYAGVYAISTVPDERKKGLAACMTSKILHIARERGYHVGILQSSPAGYSVYRALGFRDFGAVPLYLRMPG